MNRRAILHIACALFILTITAPRCFSATSSVAMVTGINKSLSVTHGGRTLKGTVGMDLFEGDGLKTGQGCQALIMLGDGSELKMNQNTEITIKAFNKEKKNIFIKLGEIFGKFLPQETKVIFETPKGVAGIEGTEFTINVNENQAEVNVNEGVVAVGENLKTKVTRDEGCTFAPGRTGTPRKAAFPQWFRNVKEYKVAMEEATQNLKSLNELKALSADELKRYMEEREKISASLQDMQPPGALSKHKKGLEKLNSDYVAFLGAALKARENPSDRGLIRDAVTQWTGLNKECRNFRDATRGGIKNWETNKKGFREEFMRRMPQARERIQDRPQRNEGRPGDRGPDRTQRPSDGQPPNRAPNDRGDRPPARGDAPPAGGGAPPASRPAPPQGK